MCATDKSTREIKPDYAKLPTWESYSSNLDVEYQQCVEEGLDIEGYKEVFEAVSKLPKDETKKKLGDILFEVVRNSRMKEEYPYAEPSDLPSIRRLRKDPPTAPEAVDASALADKIHGAWLGRICGCFLGKPIEGIRTNELIPFLKETGNYPMHRYIRRAEVTEEVRNRYQFQFSLRSYPDAIVGMPPDDDTNYMIMSQLILNDYGRDFTPENVAQAWTYYQRKNAYCTAERVAYCNFVKGYRPPDSAVYQNPYREWIGAQIRGDYFGYINPGDPEKAAEMAFRDASISHVKNGIYGEMFVSAMIAQAAVTTDMKRIILAGLAQIPHTSRLYEAVMDAVKGFEQGVSQEDCFADIHSRYDEYTEHGWCHTISNAMIVAAALLYGGGDYGRSICMAVETGFDTDCNGATVGSVIGMAYGTGCIGEEWAGPVNDTLYSSVFGVDVVKISESARKTMEHVRHR